MEAAKSTLPRFIQVYMEIYICCTFHYFHTTTDILSEALSLLDSMLVATFETEFDQSKVLAVAYSRYKRALGHNL